MDGSIVKNLQRLAIYQTNQRLYVVGSNDTETRFQVLKIDRTEPKELNITDDKHIYKRSEVQDLLFRIHAGNKPRSGLAKGISAFGIVGFVRLLEGYYIILVTKRRCVALIGNRSIYKVEDTSMIYIPNDQVKIQHPLESRYLRIFQRVDLGSNFYFSYGYDLSRSLQHSMVAAEQINGQFVKDPCWQFVWNASLIQPLKDAHVDWTLPLVHGFVMQHRLSIIGRCLSVTLIARRSSRYAGPRFLKRGANLKGYVANEVETEQIVQDTSLSTFKHSSFSSFLQMRGSVPLLWSQKLPNSQIVKVKPKPQIALDASDPSFGIAGKHFNRLMARHGSPILLLNLVKRHERRQQEGILGSELKQCLIHLNQFLPSHQKLRHVSFDMARLNKRKEVNVLHRLSRIASSSLKLSGFFCNKPVHSDYWSTHHMKVVGGSNSGGMQLQTGVIRTNCVDCLDRTNAAQFTIGHTVLGYQLYALGFTETPELEVDTDIVRLLEELYEDHGDTLALQYGGSQLVHRIRTYRQDAHWTAASRDIMQTLSRYYSNTFSDYEKQQAINLFLGLYEPWKHSTALWDLETDFCLHNAEVLKFADSVDRYTEWLDSRVRERLPLAADSVVRLDSVHVEELPLEDPRRDAFLQLYRPFEFQSFDSLIKTEQRSSTQTNIQSAQYLIHSPFLRRSPAARNAEQRFPRQSSKEKISATNPNLTGKSSNISMQSEASDTSSSSDDSQGDVTDDIPSTSSESSIPEDTERNSHQESLESTADLYRFSLVEFTRADRQAYHRYVDQYSSICLEPKEPPKTNQLLKNCLIEPLTQLPVDQPLPTVDPASVHVYTQAVRCATEGPKQPDAATLKHYAQHVYRLAFT